MLVADPGFRFGEHLSHMVIHDSTLHFQLFEVSDHFFAVFKHPVDGVDVADVLIHQPMNGLVRLIHVFVGLGMPEMLFRIAVVPFAQIAFGRIRELAAFEAAEMGARVILVHFGGLKKTSATDVVASAHVYSLDDLLCGKDYSLFVAAYNT